ncbi:MAG: hypothetical protein CSA96_04670 [Bacteroidetes bacterium]|nr:MAG: hypothetical protein CSA96_04670 [Bacteroidota bacterium]
MKAETTENKEILSSSDLQNILGLHFPGAGIISKLILRILHLDQMNAIYRNYKGPGGADFIRFASRQLRLRYEINEEALQQIPKDGAFVTISNHPYGGIDGICLLETMLERRGDFKTLSNFMMGRLEHMSENFIPLDPFHEGSKSKVNFSGIKKAIRHLRDGQPLGIFPSGEVSSYNKDYPGISDKQWNPSVMRVIQKAEVPVLPIYFHGTNSRLFHFLGRIHPLLRTARIPAEVMNKRGATVKMTIGRMIDIETQKQFSNIKDYSNHLRKCTYELANGSSKIDAIAEPAEQKVILQELAQLRQSGHCLIRKDAYEVFCSDAKAIPELMYEIGRQREISFREVGEGSNKGIDLDGFDHLYQQLIVWDHKRDRLVGAYRIGNGKMLMQWRGVRGFYSNTLFRYAPEMREMLGRSMELGRSFITREYQKKPLPLYLLWAGIFAYTKRHPNCRYLIGPVSISNDYKPAEKDRIVSYVEQFHKNAQVQALVSPRTPYLQTSSYTFEGNGFEHAPDMPVLLKKYLQINGKIAAFNVDPDFNYTLDGLLILDLKKVPGSFIHRLDMLNRIQPKMRKQRLSA